MGDIIRKIKLPNNDTVYEVYDARIDKTISGADNGNVLVINSDGKIVATKALDDKVDKVIGKGLSTNDYTTEEKNKLGGIAEGAEVNVQSDWNAIRGAAFIKNKPIIPAAVTESTVFDWGFTKNTGTITADDSTPTDPTLVNADLLNNQPANYYADKNYVDTKNFVPGGGNLNQVLTKTSNGYTWEDAQGGGIGDAPSDGNKYVRKDGAWAVSDVNIATASSAGIVKPSSDFDISADGALSLYKEITISNTAVQPRIVEIGSTVNKVIVSWAVNKQPVSQTVNGEAVDTSVRSKEFTNLGLISRMVFTVSVADARIEKTGSAAVEFYNSVFYGAAEEWNRSVMTGNVRANNLGSFSVNAGADDYIWYAIPAAYKTPRFFVGGFEGGFSLYATQNVTNASGYTESYKIFRSDNKALGQTTVTLE